MKKRIIVDVEESFPKPVWLDKISPFVSAVLDDLALEDWELSILFCSNAFIAKLNKEYRGKEGPTDILSFEQGDEYVDEDGESWFIAGDIIISLEMLQSNAVNYDISEDEELKRLLIHGILHLDGYDHGEDHIQAGKEAQNAMLVLQEKLLSTYTIKIIEDIA